VTRENALEKLKSKIRIDLVFKRGKAVRSGTLILHYFIPEEGVENTHVGVGVPKKSVIMAYRRNRIKRQIKAVIRQREEEILGSLSPGFYMLLFKGKSSVSSESLSLDFQGLLRNFRECD
jgi:ribonuclease P protein component